MSCNNENREFIEHTASSTLRGPRPPSLRVSHSSSTIKKSSAAAAANSNNGSKVNNPVVIYLRSPKVIHVKPEEFMPLVQRLTGKETSTNYESYNHNNPTTSSPLSSPSCDMVADEDPHHHHESMRMMSKKDDDGHHGDQVRLGFNEAGDDQSRGLSPTWLHFLACV